MATGCYPQKLNPMITTTLGLWLALSLLGVVILYRMFGGNPDVISDQHEVARRRHQWRSSDPTTKERAVVDWRIHTIGTLIFGVMIIVVAVITLIR